MSSGRVIVRIFGGIGNQLFCYAAARRLAVVNDMELVIDDVSGFVYDHEYQRRYQLDHFAIPCRKATASERLAPFARARRYFKRVRNQRRPFQKRSFIQQEGVDFDSRLLHVKPHGNLYIEGYWQSEEYFKDISATIRSDLRIDPPGDNVNLAMAEHIRSSPSVAVHVRFFDAPDESCTNNTSQSYYSRAIEKMDVLVPEAHFFVFSDQPEAACDRIALPANRFTIVSHNKGDENAFADLWLMTQCRHFIIANSTFSWWGAWLSENPRKHVIAPGAEIRQGKMFWGFRGLLPDEWIQL